uniref:Reverse transcriptase Ty1/copia-type domain-containing protein n=1 Tax=Heterosigma akashiwo TaxID=2829 RepID=A0A7S4D6I2_HETAK
MPGVPNTIQGAMRRADWPRWEEAIEKELAAHKLNQTWKCVEPPPPGTNIAGTRWVFSVKSNGDYKARLVVQGFSQRYGEDYFDTYAGVSRLETMRMCCAISAIEGWHIVVFDINNAFLTAPAKDKIFIWAPAGTGLPKGTVCLLLKSIYGTHQAAHDFQEYFSSKMVKLKALPTKSDPCLYVRKEEPGRPTSLTHSHVDDCLTHCKSRKEAERFVAEVNEELPLRSGGTEYLSAQIERGPNLEVYLTQTRMLLDIVQTELGNKDFNPNKTPMSKKHGKTLAKRRSDQPAHKDPKMLQRIVGKLIFPMIFTRPDLSQAVLRLARYASDPTDDHMKAAKHTLRYVRGTVDRGLVYKRGGLKDIRKGLVAFSDSDWAADPDDRKSTTGMALFLGLCLIMWKSLKQPLVALSTAESEYIALAYTIKHVLLQRLQLCHVGYEQQGPTPVFVDNISAMHIAEGATKSSKFIDLRWHFIRDAIARGEVKVVHIDTEHNISDLFTKPLESPRFQMLREQLLGTR